MTAMLTAKKPDTAAESSRTRHRILVTGGEGAPIDSVIKGLEGLRIDVARADWREYPEALDPTFSAMVLVEPLPVSVAGAVAAVRGRPTGANLAVYAVVAPDAGPRRARNAYLAGATAVIEWPREKRILADILAETMGMTLVRGVSTFPDVALTRTVRAHLRAGPRPGSAIRLSSRKGIVTVSGQVDTFAGMREIVETIARVPGVKHILTAGLRVAPSDLPDRRVRTGVKAVMRALSDIDEKDLRVAVRNGRVQLTGAVPSRSEFHRLLDSIAAVRGVRDLDWKITLAGRRTESDSRIARRLRRALATLHPDEDLAVRVAGGVAVLSGQTPHLATKRAVERLVERDEGVVRVVNKIMVT